MATLSRSSQRRTDGRIKQPRFKQLDGNKQQERYSCDVIAGSNESSQPIPSHPSSVENEQSIGTNTNGKETSSWDCAREQSEDGVENNRCFC